MVGIGSSAGGLEALRHLLPDLPAEDNSGYIVVEHLDPKHPSMLGQLLASHTTMQISEAKHREPVRARRIFVTPSGRHGATCALPRDGYN